MGLLEQVIGQVIGGLSGGSQSQAPHQPSPAGPGGGGGLPGGLGSILAGAGGKYSPLVLALLSLLASKQMSSGAGGYGSVLHDMLGKLGGGFLPGGGAPDDAEPRQGPGSGWSRQGPSGRGGYDSDPEGDERDGDMGPDGRGMGGPEDEPRGRGGRGSRDGGGFLDNIGSMLDGPGGRRPDDRERDEPGGGGTSGGPTHQGFEDLFDRFRRNGRSDLMESWVGGGANKQASPSDLNEALGPDIVDQLSRQTGLDRHDLLSQLSHALPRVVDKLTPHGRPPSQDEQRGWV